MRAGVWRLALLLLIAGCSDDKPLATTPDTDSAAIVKKNCADPHWKEQNLGLWYSVCRQPLRW